jgi:hypothetical protein
MDDEQPTMLSAAQLETALKALGDILAQRGLAFETEHEIEAARRWFATVETPASGFWVNLDAVLEELSHA